MEKKSLLYGSTLPFDHLGEFADVDYLGLSAQLAEELWIGEAQHHEVFVADSLSNYIPVRAFYGLFDLDFEHLLHFGLLLAK